MVGRYSHVSRVALLSGFFLAIAKRRWEIADFILQVGRGRVAGESIGPWQKSV